MKGVEKSPASATATKVEYTKLSRYIIHKVVTSYLRSFSSSLDESWMSKDHFAVPAFIRVAAPISAMPI
jgi:hypothetical protein